MSRPTEKTSHEPAGAAEGRPPAPTSASLTDKFDLGKTRQLLTGSQAVVRLMLMQHARDKAAGLNTAGYVTGYRGSPIAALEGTFLRFKPLIEKSNILFHSGLNEDLAATALWGAQQAELRGEGKYDGVFGLWYGKGPGVDRSGDAFRHANHAGTSKYGGVLALMGDDHTCESSTSAHQSEFAFVDAMMPVLNPAGVQEILDYGLIGYALSRYAGVWVGLKCVKDNIESTATVDGSLDRVKITIPEDFTMPEGGLNIRLGDSPLAREARLHDYKRDAILAFGRANGLDRIVFSGGRAPKIGIMSAGKSWLDTRQALDELGIDEVEAAKIGLRLYKVGMTYPMEPQGFKSFADGLDIIIVVEEKRALLEVQALEQLYGTPDAPILVGKKDENGAWLFPAKGALDPVDIAIHVGERIIRHGDGDGEQIKSRIAQLKQVKGNRITADEITTRIPYFCAGCPHNSSTILPEGARAYAGIGCHYMVQWMDRNTEGFTQMGAEGVNWIGEAPFSKRRHVFQNLGDGTYIHSGSLAIRAAVAAGTNITFKILYNDAVAMTGGQALDGGMSVGQMAAQVLAEGVSEVAIVTDEPGKYDASSGIPSGVPIHHRDDLQLVQTEMAKKDGVTVLIYDQTCAAEKRRRRKRGTYPDPKTRVFINPAVCEGCGDCGVQSNCIAILPLETELGRKREIDQSACNKDFSCLNGFCPSFVTVRGATIRKGKEPGKVILPDEATAGLPEPELPELDKPYTMLVAGVGGTGVVTISAVLGQAAFLNGKGFGAIDMTGLAQKGGAVACHMRLAKNPEDIHAIRAGVAS
ncbi:MAG TPA: indolepyruvate ferredoxin oxidoreductase family protein, partial [Rhodobacteraceae bacterium]|nr:indolepyruvate ferredoxin oxidoreductase family protein [Paracoccaceae bacterium]